MDILWSALGIGAIVCVLFYLLAAHWQGILRHQSRTVRILAQRVSDLEQISDPEFQRRLDESSPMPLEQVLTFSVRLSEQFWRSTLGLTEQDWDFARAYGSFLGSVKLERWRSHTVATVTEAMPAGHSTRWQKRSLDFYSEYEDALPLWELRLGLPGASGERPPSVELLLRKNAIELRGRLWADGQGTGSPEAEAETTFFDVPLDARQLAEFHRLEPIAESQGNNGDSTTNRRSAAGASWRQFYSGADDRVGFEWQLYVRDLARKADWERWKILDPVGPPVGREP